LVALLRIILVVDGANGNFLQIMIGLMRLIILHYALKIR